MNKANIYINTSHITFATVQNSTLMHYSGYLKSSSIDILLIKIEDYLLLHNTTPGTKRRITGIAIELLQNIYHHSLSETIDDGEEMPSFGIEKKEHGFILTATNLIHSDKVTLLENHLTILNSYPPKKLENLYQDVLKNGKQAGEHARLGWIDIFRKSGKPVLFKFTPQGNNCYLFTVSIFA